jgi:hypothetical protein
MSGNTEYVKYVISKMDCPSPEGLKPRKVPRLDTNIFNIMDLNKLIQSDSFKRDFNNFAELQTIVYENEIEIERLHFLNGIIVYRPIIDIHNYIFCCCKKEAGVVNFKELYSKRCKKIIGHIVLEGKFDELIHHLEERVLINM